MLNTYANENQSRMVLTRVCGATPSGFVSTRIRTHSPRAGNGGISAGPSPFGFGGGVGVAAGCLRKPVIGAVRRPIREMPSASRGSGCVGLAAARTGARSVGGRNLKAGSAPAFEGRGGGAELLLERGREVACIRVAEVRSHHGHRGVTLAQAPTRFVHAFPLE